MSSSPSSGSRSFASTILVIRFFGEFEFWLSSIKVVVLVGPILLSLILALGGGPNHDRAGSRYWKSPGAFKPYIADGAEGRFLGFWGTMVTATFAYLGTELVGVTVGEAQNPRKTIPRAIKLTFYRVLFFYVLSVLLLDMLVPYNSRELLFANKSKSSAAASPFVVAIKLTGIKALPGILNGCILLFVSLPQTQTFTSPVAHAMGSPARAKLQESSSARTHTACQSLSSPYPQPSH